MLKAKLEEEEEDKLWTHMEYVAGIEKGPSGVGFGMVVVEDAKTSRVIAKVIMEGWEHYKNQNNRCPCYSDVCVHIYLYLPI